MLLMSERTTNQFEATCAAAETETFNATYTCSTERTIAVITLSDQQQREHAEAKAR